MYPYFSFPYQSFIYPYSSINPFTLFLLPLSALSLFRSLARPLPFSLTGRSLSLSRFPSLSLWMVRLFCGFDFLSDFLPLELLQSSLSPTSLPHPLPLSLSLSLFWLLLLLSLTLARSLSLSLMFVCSSEVSCLTIHTPTHPHTHALSKSNLCPPSFLLQVSTLTLRLARPL